MSDNPEEQGLLTAEDFKADFTHFKVTEKQAEYEVKLTNQREERRVGKVSIVATNQDNESPFDRQFDETFEQGETVKYSGSFYHGMGAGDVLRITIDAYQFGSRYGV